MPDNNNEAANRAMDQFIDMLNNFAQQGNANIFEIAETKRKLEEIIKNFPVSELRELKNRYADNNEEISEVFKRAITAYENKIKAEEEYQAKVRSINDDIGQLQSLMEQANEDEKEFYRDKINARQQQLRDEEEQHKAELEGRATIYQAQKEAEQRRKEAEEKYAQEVEEAAKRHKQAVDKFIDSIGNGASRLFSQFTNMFSGAIDRITSSYEQKAGQLAAALDSSVSDISKLQHNIANALEDQSLNRAISSVAVFNEMSSLASYGYTNENLQESATGIAIARQVAPGMNFDTSTVRNLTNIFGNDFIQRFAAIQAAVQETAGATVGLNEHITKMMTDLEPVYQNAQYNLTATQDMSSIQATLSAAIDAGLLNESQANEYMNMIAELMDPSKAFRSSSTAVRVAATNYDFGSGSPLQALEALLNARGQMYGGVSMSNDYWGNISRSLVASAYGDNTLNATYMQSGLTGLDILRTGDLQTTYNQRLQSLESGDYTTTSQQEQNVIENSGITQTVADIAKWLPATYAAFSGTLFALINSLPTRIADAIRTGYDANFTASGISGGITAGGSTVGGLNGKLLNQTTGIGGIFNSFANRSLFGLGTVGSRTAQLTSGLTVGAGIAGIAGGLNLADSINENGLNIQGFGFGGNHVESALSYAGMGAGIGAIVGSIIPGVGNVIGTAVGALAGAIVGLTTATIANSEKQEENTQAVQASIDNTKSLLGKGVTAVDAIEANRIIAEGGGIAHLASGDYELAYDPPSYARGLDFVPYDGYITKLHRGEAVVSADAAEQLRAINPNFWRGNTTMNTDYDIVGALDRQTESIVSAVNGDKQYMPLVRSAPKTYRIANANR